MKWMPTLCLVAACAAAPFDPAPNIVVDQFTPPPTWRAIYTQVATCAADKVPNFDAIRWYWVETGGGPWQGQDGNTYGMTRPESRQIYLIRDDTTYLRHEMLHDILWQSGWRPPAKDSLTIADLHPSPPFGICTGGR